MIEELLDIESFKRFYNEHYDPIMRYCTSIVKDETEASDIVQQTFIVLWQKRNELSVHTSIKSYLYKMIYNHSLQFLEQSKRRKLQAKDTRYLQGDEYFADRSSERELQNLIAKAINKLPEQCRRIFQLSRDENLKYREISVQLNISEKTVENQMGKALKLLKEALKEYLPILLLLISLHHE